MLSGMDGFLTKPLNVDRLRSTLDGFGLRRTARAPHDQTSPAASPSSSPARDDAQHLPILDIDSGLEWVNLSKLHEVTDGDAEFTAELLSTFYASVEQILAEIADHHASGDRAKVAGAAHKLKGASANIHAHVLATAAAGLENEAAAMSPENLHAEIEKLGQVAHQTIAYLKGVRPSSISSSAA